MADVILRYFLAALDHDRASPAGERWLARPIERVLLSAAIRVDVTAVRLRTERRRVQASVSEAAKLVFRDAPPAGTVLTEPIRLKGTEATEPCAGCAGTGLAACGSCAGEGKAVCPRCQGDPGFEDVMAKEEGVFGTPCRRCHGARTETCGDCSGSGTGRHVDCDGRGVVRTWEELSFQRLVETDRDIYLPPEAPDTLPTAVSACLLREEPIVALTPETLATSVGYRSDAFAALCAQTEETTRKLERRILLDGDACESTGTRYRVVPIAGCLPHFWLVGRGADAIELPSMAPDTRGWLSSLRRRPEPPVRTVLLLPSGESPTITLACLAALGAYTRRFEVLDQQHREQLETLLGEEPSDAVSRTLLLRLADGRLVRLLELARPQEVDAQERSRLLAAVDGVVHLSDDSRSTLRRLRDDFLQRTPGIDWEKECGTLWRPFAELLGE